MNPSLTKLISHTMAFLGIAFINFVIAIMYFLAVAYEAYKQAPKSQEFDIGGPLFILILILFCIVFGVMVSFLIVIISTIFKKYYPINFMIQAIITAIIAMLVAMLFEVKFLVSKESAVIEIGLLFFVCYLLHNVILRISDFIIVKLGQKFF